jgi:hypothetical protein
MRAVWSRRRCRAIVQYCSLREVNELAITGQRSYRRLSFDHFGGICCHVDKGTPRGNLVKIIQTDADRPVMLSFP